LITNRERLGRSRRWRLSLPIVDLRTRGYTVALRQTVIRPRHDLERRPTFGRRSSGQRRRRTPNRRPPRVATPPPTGQGRRRPGL